MKKTGILTFHNSYNCGSMLQSYAMQNSLKKLGIENEIINFSNEGQKELYLVTYKNRNLKNFIKNIIIFPHKKKVVVNNQKYEEFKTKHFELSQKSYTKMEELSDEEYDKVIVGSDQIWNTTIMDSDDAYFLPWVKKAKKIAYAPSFGAKRLEKYVGDIEKYKKYLHEFEHLSIREKNGQTWLKELLQEEVPVVLDPTLLLEKEDYEKIEAKDIEEKEKYIFFYCPSFDSEICKFVKKISDKYKLKVIVWSAKEYYLKYIKRYGFILAEYENPSSYLYYIKNAELVFTTSFHGTIFSSIYRKKFYVIKNGGMYEDDDRVKTLVTQLGIEDRLVPYEFDANKDYLEPVNYEKYSINLKECKEKSLDYLRKSLGEG